MLLLLAACSTTSSLPEGEKLYVGIDKISYTDYEKSPHFTTTQEEVEAALERYRRAHGKVAMPHVAVMGCAVNGPGEAKDADVALCGGNGEFLLYVHGRPVRKVPPSEAVSAVLAAVCAPAPSVL